MELYPLPALHLTESGSYIFTDPKCRGILLQLAPVDIEWSNRAC